MAGLRKNYKNTVYACFIGYIVQAIVNNFIPLLFITFQTDYNIPLNKITLLVTFNFGIQLVTDLVSAGFIDKIGYRISLVLAHVFAATGLFLLTVLPDILPDAFTGILVSVAFYAVGGGLIEVLVSPVLESCPTDNKEKAMSLLHSFYCWGHAGVVLLSTIFFKIFGMGSWKVLMYIWITIPVINSIIFTKVPIASLIEDGSESMGIAGLFKEKIFWTLMLMMVCAGASEQAVSQWASFFAEKGLGVGKAAGDLAGPMAFALLMGSSRAFYGKYGDKINLDKFMAGSSVLCIFSYLITSLAPVPAINLAGCALCGLSVGIMWPGSFSKAAAVLRHGGTAMFALLALGGDLGCSGGPALAGMVSSLFGNNLKTGILAAAAFPVLLLLSLCVCRYQQKECS
ncbi:MAG TPA: MFS transporter [Lachnospiraceae bacterium]|nr:MFS transporter [Lachnospiraceae bacterium]